MVLLSLNRRPYGQSCALDVGKAGYSISRIQRVVRALLATSCEFVVCAGNFQQLLSRAESSIATRWQNLAAFRRLLAPSGNFVLPLLRSVGLLCLSGNLVSPSGIS